MRLLFLALLILQDKPRCTDAQFLRRASLDLIGRVPTIDELRAFEKNPDRAAKIDALLESDEFCRTWSEMWSIMLNGYTDAYDSVREGLRLWLRDQLKARRPYDEIATELISATGETAGGGAVNFIARNYVNPAVKVSRVFLGIRIHCAQCHDHPFDRWTNDDYKNLTRFFEPMERRQITNGNAGIFDSVAKGKSAPPKFLTGAKPVTTRWREEFAYHMRRSRAFKLAYVNRLWYHFMGKGFVEPADDIRKPTKELDALADRAVWDIRAMIRIICLSEEYQRPSMLKPLTPEQVYDSAKLTLDLKMTRKEFVREMVGQDVGEEFINLWDNRETVQSVMTKLAIDLPTPKVALDELFWRMLSRAPTAKELERCRGVDLRDVAGALLNSNEFLFNH